MVNIIGGQNLVPPIQGDPSQKANPKSAMTAKAILQCRPNSHPFPDRVLLLDQPVKVGRSVARGRPAKNNAIFDCKVLSRNHALLWYENGKFYLQDTKSSNGTFVNNQRLSKGSEESAPREVCSGDIVQYGVDVVENSRKGMVTHGCIIATLKLYMPDGQEAKASPSTVVRDGSCTVSASDFLHLRTCLQEAQHREQVIETKLSSLQQLIAETQEAASNSWAAMIDEDRLLQRLENLEEQLATYVKNYPEDTSREEIQMVLHEKNRYEMTVKESLQRILQDKLDVLAKYSNLERSMSCTNNELKYMSQVAETAQNELQELVKRQAEQTLEYKQTAEQLKIAQEKLTDKIELEAKSNEDKKMIAQIESLKAENDFTKEQLSAIKSKYENIKNGRLNLEFEHSESEITKHFQTFRSTVDTLQERLWQAQEELHQGQVVLTQLRNEVKDADEAEIQSQTYHNQLQEELNAKKVKEECNITLIDHLQSHLSILNTRLQNLDESPPKIYDDIFDDEMLLRKYKKSLKEEEEEEENEKSEERKDLKSEKSLCDSDLEDSDSLTDSTLTIINSDVMDKNNINGSGNSLFSLDSEQVIYLKEDLMKLRELLQLAEASKSNAVEELERIREEYGRATSSSVTIAHEAANLRKQLAANEAILLEKTHYMATLLEVGGQLESSLDLIYSHLIALTQRINCEKEETRNAKNEVEELKVELNEAERICKESIEEVEKLKFKISHLEEKPSLRSCLESAHVNTLAKSSEKTVATGSEIKIGDLVREQTEVSPLLETEIEMLKIAYTELKEREDRLKLQMGAKSEESPGDKSSTFLHRLSSTESANSKLVAKLKDELNALMEEHKELKEILAYNDRAFPGHSLQNPMALLTYLIPLMIVVLGFIVAFHDMVSAFTGTSEYNELSP